MIDQWHPNFPLDLSIVPNLGPTGKAGDSPEGNRRNAFGVVAQREAIARYGIAGRVWEAAYALCAYVDPTRDDEFDPPFVADPDVPLSVIELGSGTGIVAEAVARAVRRAGGCVIATDLPDVCPLLQSNLGCGPLRGGSGGVCVRPLAWGDLGHAVAIADELGVHAPASPRRLTHVVCSDLVYFPDLFGPLLRTLLHLTSPSLVAGRPVAVVISYKVRSLSKETPFWAAFGLWFAFRPVLARRRLSARGVREDAGPWRRFGADDDGDRLFVFVAHRRPESIGWHVPDSDRALLDGVGARDTGAIKGDEMFETLLFMGMGVDDAGE